MHKLFILVLTGLKTLHLYVIACNVRYIIDICKKVLAKVLVTNHFALGYNWS